MGFSIGLGLGLARGAGNAGAVSLVVNGYLFGAYTFTRASTATYWA